MTILRPFKDVPKTLLKLRNSFQFQRKESRVFLLLIDQPEVHKYLKTVITKAIPNAKTIHYIDYDDKVETGNAPKIDFLLTYTHWINHHGCGTARLIEQLNPSCTSIYVGELLHYLDNMTRMFLNEDFNINLQTDVLSFAAELCKIVLLTEKRGLPRPKKAIISDEVFLAKSK